jgi:hypothetical protein
VDDLALKWWHVRWRPALRGISRFAIVAGKILAVLCLVAAVGYGVLYLIFPWLTAQRLSRVDPRLNIVPASLSTNAEAPLSTTTLDYCGLRLVLPNGTTAKAVGHQQITLVQFSNGTLMVISPLCYPSIDSGLAPETNNTREASRLGRESTHSTFALEQTAMSATPNQVKWWRFRSYQNRKNLLLLYTKFFAFNHSILRNPFSAHPIYTVSFGEYRGFQIGDPSVPPYEASIELFDKSDQSLSLNLIGLEGHEQVITQEELNAFIASIHPVPSQDTSSPH